MNLNHVSIGYDKTAHSIVLLGPEEIPEVRPVHQSVMDALVQYFKHEQPPFCEQKINSHGKNYVLRMTPCK